MSYLVQARHRERRDEIQTFTLVRLNECKIEPSSVQEAEQFVKEWGDYNEFWEYTLVNPESKMQSRFEFTEELCMKYIPDSDDIVFANFVVRMIADGGVWEYPDAGLVYLFNRTEKSLTLVHPKLEFGELSEYQKEMHERGRQVFGAVGWTVKP